MKWFIPLLVLSLVLTIAIIPVEAGRKVREQQLPLAEAVFVTSEEHQEYSIDYSGCGGQFPPAINASYEQELVYLINQERATRGLPPYKRVEELDYSARYHAYDLGHDNYFAHDTKDWVNGELQTVCSPWDRIIPYYTPPGWLWLGETIAGGQPTPQDVLTTLMNSAPHRDILLSPDMWEIGVGYYRTEDGRTYWVQDFGKRSDTFPLVINADAAKTQDEHVSLYVYGAWQDVRLRNDDSNWSGWMSFTPELQWDLANSPGEHTVWAELRSGTESVVTSDTIKMAVTVPLTEVCFLPIAQR